VNAIFNFEDVRERLLARRKRFIYAIGIYSVLGVAVFVLTLIFINDIVVSFLGSVTFILSAIVLSKVVERAKNIGVFRRETSGKVIKVHVSSAVNSSRLGGKYAFRPKLTEKIYAYVAIETSDGEVDIIEGLSAAQAQYFMEGDEVICLSGSKYPVILAGGRERENALCPICGRLFFENEQKCISCGIDVKLT